MTRFILIRRPMNHPIEHADGNPDRAVFAFVGLEDGFPKMSTPGSS